MKYENKKLADVAKANAAKFGNRPYEEEFIEEMRKNVIKARVRLGIRQPFYGRLVLNYEVIIVNDANHHVKTCAIDGRYIYYNPEYVNAISDSELFYSLSFLLLRVIFHHVTRRGSRDQEMFYAAGAYVINNILIRDNIGEPPSKTIVTNEEGVNSVEPYKTLIDERFNEMTTDQVYLKLLEEGDEDKQQGGGEGQGQGQGEGEGQGQVGNSGLDQPLDSQDSGQSEDDILDIENAMNAAIQQAAAGSSIGSVPGEIQRWIAELNEPTLNWRSFLHENATSRIKSDYTWKRPNRRMQGAFPNIMFPSQKINSSIKFVIAIDNSGSMSDDMICDILSEVAGVANHFKEFEVTVMCWDTIVYPQSVKTFDKQNIHEINQYKPYGGGGTNPSVCWDYMKENEMKPDMFVQFTDGYISDDQWGDPEYCDTFWIIHDKSKIAAKAKAPFGKTLYYAIDD